MTRRGYEARWEIIGEPLGKGGQGIVYKVIDNNVVPRIQTILHEFKGTIKGLALQYSSEESDHSNTLLLQQVFERLQLRQTITALGALKVLHEPQNARDPALADKRLKNELRAMQMIQHPNIVKILDANEDEQWYVSRFYPGGTLFEESDLFKGDVTSALKAFRDLVSGVAEIHKAGMVHRDIKPHNIFIGDHGKLMLGDFGLIFFRDDDHSRISHTLENVGSRDWMPAWAQGLRIDEISPTFDVFSLGKVLWSMIAGRKILPLWYFEKPNNDLRRMFPDSPDMILVNELFSKCIVEEEDRCIPSAVELLTEVDKLILQLGHGGCALKDNPTRQCKVCGIGKYTIEVSGDERDIVSIQSFGFRPTGMRTFRICSCNHCGHVQIFKRTINDVPPAWK